MGEDVSQFYYLRQDATGTGNTILGRLNPSTTPGVRTISDIANLGGVFDTLTLARAATGPADAWATSPTLFASGAALAVGAQSVSFAAIADKNVSVVSFPVNPTASSGLGITLTVVAGSTGTVTIVSPIGGVGTFNVTPTGSGIVTLEARQSGPGFVTNWLRQSFNILGPPVITTQPASQTVAVGAAANLSVVANGTAPLTYQWSKNNVAIAGATTITTQPLPLTVAANRCRGRRCDAHRRCEWLADTDLSVAQGRHRGRRSHQCQLHHRQHGGG